MISDFYHSVATVFTLVDGTQLMMAGIHQFQDSVYVQEVSKQLPS
jgi:endonuclease/exonuclease/phosphatase (EEP) superfamily protein YafD